MAIGYFQTRKTFFFKKNWNCSTMKTKILFIILTFFATLTKSLETTLLLIFSGSTKSFNESKHRLNLTEVFNEG